MKKLMVLAAVAAIGAMSAKAALTITYPSVQDDFDETAPMPVPGNAEMWGNGSFWFDESLAPALGGYKQVYLLTTSQYANWQKAGVAASTLQDFSFGQGSTSYTGSRGSYWGAQFSFGDMTFDTANIELENGNAWDTPSVEGGVSDGDLNFRRMFKVDGAQANFVALLTDESMNGYFVMDVEATVSADINFDDEGYPSSLWFESVDNYNNPFNANDFHSLGGTLAVPEPTSGLLLLLGVAGLALKRKRA